MSDDKFDFECGHCGKIFRAFNDGEGWNTGLCPTCLTLQDTVGLDDFDEEKFRFEWGRFKNVKAKGKYTKFIKAHAERMEGKD